MANLSATEINELYLHAMLNATENKAKILYRIKEYWWPNFLESYNKDPSSTLNALDLCMDAGQTQLRDVARGHAENLGFEAGSSEFIQRINQVLKSSTGKMFERFIALSIAHSLLDAGSKYCVWSFTNSLRQITDVFRKQDLEVVATLGETEYRTAIDADFVIFDPASKDSEYYLVSIKSTLKDRFHNVPFWNLLRHAAISGSMENVTPINLEEAAKPKYIAICSDLAAEQPDFSSDNGPRNMLSLDAALLDGAYVTASRAKGLGDPSKGHMGTNREAPFYPLSAFVDFLL